MSQKKIVNKRLVALLMDHKKIDVVTVDKTYVVAQVNKKFFPSDLKTLVAEIGQDPKCTTQDGVNCIIFNRRG